MHLHRHILVLAMAILVLPAAGPGVAAEPSDTYGAIERLRREQDYIAACALAAELLPVAADFDSLTAVADFNLMADLACEAADFPTARIANRAALGLAGALGTSARFGLAEAMLREAILDRRSSVRTALEGGRLSPREEFAARLGQVAGLLADFPDSHRVHGALLQFRANVERTFDGSERALGSYAAAADYRRAHLERPSLALADNLVWLGWNLNEAGRTDAAQRALDEAEAELTALGLQDHTLMATVHELRFDRAAARADLAACRRLASREAAIQHASRRGFPFGDARIAACPLNGYRRLAWTALQEGDDAGAFQAWSRSLAPVTEEYLGLGARLQALPAAARKRITDLYAQLSRTVATIEGQGQGIRIPDATAALQAWSRFQVELRALGADGGVPVVTVAEVQATLEPDQAMLGQFHLEFGGRHIEDLTLDRFEVWVVIVRPGTPLRWVKAQQIAGAALDDQVREDARITTTLRRAANWPLRLDADPDLDRGLRRIAERVVNPARPYLAGVTTLVTVGVPLNTVISFCEQAPRAVVNAPSPGVLVDLAGRDDGPAQDARALVVGVGAGLEGHGEISPDAEVRALADILTDPLVLTGAEASRQRFRELDAAGVLAAVDHAHFASHMQTGSTPRRNALVLADGPLEAWTLFFATGLRPRTLVLAGCSSSGGGGHTWYEYHGLAQVMLGAGVRQVVASRWKVDDGATTLFMERFYRHLRGKGVPRLAPALALAEAAVWLRDWADESGERPYAHPVYWAGFVISGVP